MNYFIHNVNWLAFLKQWWLSILLIPFVIYHVHQVYWTLHFNIFFSISYSFPFPINLENFLVQNFLLIVHEAGHTFYGFFGNRTLTILGGSLNEILLPVIILAYFIFNKKAKGTQFGFYLVGSAWISVAFYAADGAQRQLPLIANLGRESHDWGILLRQWNMVDMAGTFGIIFASIGIICFILALLVPFWMKKYEEIDLDLSI